MIDNTERLIRVLLRTALSDDFSDRSFFSELNKENWSEAFKKLSEQGLAALSFEGVKKVPKELAPPKEILLQWYSQQLAQIKQFNSQRSAIRELVELWESAGIQVKELKGQDVGRLYPHPELRFSCDFDCFLSDYELGNQIVEAKGIKVDRSFYKNSSFFWKGVYVENHRFCTPVRGSREMKRLEFAFANFDSITFANFNSIALSDFNSIAFANFNALFLMEHMYSHFFEDALGLKQVMDWVLFRSKCWSEVDAELFEREARACGFWNFSQSIEQISERLLLPDSSMNFEDKYTQRLWEQIYAGGGSVEMNSGWRTRIQLFANYFRNGWRYRAFSNHSAFYVLLRTIAGFLFDRNPKIN